MICCPSQAPLAEVLLSTGARAFFCPILTTRTLKWRKREDKERQTCNKQTSNTDVSFQPQLSPSPRLTGQLLQKFVQPATILHVVCQEAQAMASDSDGANVWLNKTVRVKRPNRH